jgi:hypothetical protein
MVPRVVSAVKFGGSELKGQYQTLVEAQAAVRGDPDDPDLIAAVLAATQNLFGPQGAYTRSTSGNIATTDKIGTAAPVSIVDPPAPRRPRQLLPLQKAL